MPNVRSARPADALALSQLAEATFRATFAGTNSAEQIALHCRSSFGESIQSAEIGSPDMATLLAEEQGSLIGYAQLSWGQAPECVVAQRPAEVKRVYVADQWHGRGVAQALMHACSTAARERGSDALWLGVWEHNPRAIAFYVKSGFVEVGDHTFWLGDEPQRDVVMLKVLGQQ